MLECSELKTAFCSSAASDFSNSRGPNLSFPENGSDSVNLQHREPSIPILLARGELFLLLLVALEHGILPFT